MGTRRQSKGPPFMERSSYDLLLPRGLENSVPNSALSGANEGRGGSDLNSALPGASGLGCRQELARVAGCGLGPAEVRRLSSETGVVQNRCGFSPCLADGDLPQLH